MSYKLFPNNDFPKIGIISLENSGENILRYYLERIFDLQTSSNIKNFNDKFKHNSNPDMDLAAELNWMIYTDFPLRDKNPFYKTQLIMTNNETLKSNYIPSDISLGLLLVKNPIEQIMSNLVLNYEKLNNYKQKLVDNKDKKLEKSEIELNIIDDLIDDWKYFVNFWIESPIPLYVVRYEDLISDPERTLRGIIQFIIGVDNINSTLIESRLIDIISIKPDKSYYPVDFELEKTSKSLFSNKNTIVKIQQRFDDQMFDYLQQFNYEDSNSKWMKEFNEIALNNSSNFHSVFEGDSIDISFNVLSIYSD